MLQACYAIHILSLALSLSRLLLCLTPYCKAKCSVCLNDLGRSLPIIFCRTLVHQSAGLGKL